VIRVCTIGFTQKSARQFFEALRVAGVKRVIDVRLNNTSQLAGFAKRDDLEYFLKGLAGIDYEPCPLLAPTPEMLEDYRKRKGPWDDYERRFRELLVERKVEDELDPDLLHESCLLCSEHLPHHCHRRVAAEYLAERWGGVEIEHLT
jgi:uncharacterized protein (DUF488 family)